KGLNGSGSRGFALNNTAFGPLVAFNIDFSFQQKQDLAVDLLHGDVLHTGLTIGEKFRFALSQQVPGPGSRAVTGAGDEASTAAEEYDPAFDSTEPTLQDVFNAPLSDYSLSGFSGNFTGTAETIVLTNPDAIAVVSFANPEIAGDRNPANRFNQTSYFGLEYFDSDTIVTAAAVGGGSSSDLLVVTSNSVNGKLWFIQQGEAIEIATLGTRPKRLRCLNSTLCAVIDDADNTLTTISLLESTLPTVKTTVSIGSQPQSLDLLLDDSGNYVALTLDSTGDSSQYHLVKLDANANLIDSESYTIDSACADPGEAIWVRDTVSSKVLVTCPGALSPAEKAEATYWIDAPFNSSDDDDT
ncbi:MAG: hypothetical protein ACPHN3_05325, partial [Spongiibacter sp.]